MKMYEEVEILRRVLLISGLGQVHASTALPFRKRHQNPLNWWLGGTQVTFPERKYSDTSANEDNSIRNHIR